MAKQFTFSVGVRGIPDTLMRLKGARWVATKTMARALYKEAEMIMAASKGKYVPVKSGALRTSGHVALPKFKGFTANIEMGYGGPAVPYAVVQHESLHFEHRHGEAKYLETPALDAAQGMGHRVGNQVHDALRALAKRQGV